VRDWRVDLSRGEAARLGLLQGELLGELGYPESPRANVVDRAVLAGWRVAVEAQRTSRRWRGLPSADWW
jgi:hypothetical protein